MRGALDLPKNGIKWQFFGVFRAHVHQCTWTASGSARSVARRRGSAIVRALVGSVKEERHSRSWFRYQLLYDRPGPPIGPKVKGRLMSHSQKDLRGQKNLGPRTLWREGGGASRFMRHVEVEDQDKITPGDPARGENTTLRDAAKETSKQDQVKLARSPDPSIAQPVSRGNPFVDGVLLGARTAVAYKTRSPTRSRSTGSSQRSRSRPTPRSSTHDCGRKYRASGDRCGTEPERTGEYDPCGSRTWMSWRPSAGHYDPCLVFGIPDGLRNR